MENMDKPLKNFFSDAEQRILLAAIGREMEVAEKEDHLWGDDNSNTLVDITNSICKKIFGRTYYGIIGRNCCTRPRGRSR